MSRIKLGDTVMSSIIAMADGNPGAMNAMLEIMTESSKIDPQHALGPIGQIMSLDTYEIYGPEIWVLYKDQCQFDVRKVLVLLRACQLGFLPVSRLQAACKDRYPQTLLTDEEISDLDEKVCEKLSHFKKPEATPDVCE